MTPARVHRAAVAGRTRGDRAAAAVALLGRLPDRRVPNRPRGGRGAVAGRARAGRGPRRRRCDLRRLAVLLGRPARARGPDPVPVPRVLPRRRGPIQRRAGQPLRVHLGRQGLRDVPRLDPGLPEEARLDPHDAVVRGRKGNAAARGRRPVRRHVRRERPSDRPARGHARARLEDRADRQRPTDAQHPALPGRVRGSPGRVRAGPRRRLRPRRERDLGGERGPAHLRRHARGSPGDRPARDATGLPVLVRLHGRRGRGRRPTPTGGLPHEPRSDRARRPRARRDARRRHGPRRGRRARGRRRAAVAGAGDAEQDPRDPPDVPLARGGIQDGAHAERAFLLHEAAVVLVRPSRAGVPPTRLPLPQLRGRGRGRDRAPLPPGDRRRGARLRGRLHGRERLGRARLPPCRSRLDAPGQGAGRVLPARPGDGRPRRRRSRGPDAAHVRQR